MKVEKDKDGYEFVVDGEGDLLISQRSGEVFSTGAWDGKLQVKNLFMLPIDKTTIRGAGFSARMAALIEEYYGKKI